MPVEKEKIKKTARMYALQNAIQFHGKANEKAVAGKVIAAFKKESISPKEIIPVVSAVVEEINNIPLEEQVLELEQIAPELLHKEKKDPLTNCLYPLKLE